MYEQLWALDPLELELLASCEMPDLGTRNETPVLWESREWMLITAEPPLQPVSEDNRYMIKSLKF